MKASAAVVGRTTSSSVVLAIVFFFLGAYIYTRCISDGSSILTSVRSNGFLNTEHLNNSASPIRKWRKRIEIPFNCSTGNQTRTCPSNFPLKYIRSKEEYNERSLSPAAVCPDYFRWIHHDLQPWKSTGITEEMVNRAKTTANFRLVIVNGKAYVEIYEKAFQSRDTFTLWGILQLLRRYPGRLPDLDMMFDCVDWPVIKSSDYQEGPNATAPPPLFRYCANDTTLDIVFPDWSFWGWPEINIKPWDTLLEELKEGNRRTKWIERDPYAYWKGNPVVAETRMDLLKCNVSEKQDWNARVYAQDWGAEIQKGFEQSNLANQCTHRYKIYIEGSAWSVSEKYILACDSLTLLVKPLYYDFFTRGLVPRQHYWPVKATNKCRSIKFAVDWGNSHQQEAQGIGKAASRFVQEDLRMDNIYDYMFHLLNEYGKLLRYKPTVPEQAVEFCAETMACPEQGTYRKFMMESMVKAPSDTGPCTLPPPFDPPALQARIKSNGDSIKEVEMWEEGSQSNQQRLH